LNDQKQKKQVSHALPITFPCHAKAQQKPPDAGARTLLFLDSPSS
jgi:hypothetical protein